MIGTGRTRRTVRHPVRLVPLAFAGVVALGTVLMMLPVARAGDGHAPFVTALFTATSAVCVTGLASVDTAGYWSPTGQIMILVMTQVGGFGIMTMATLLGLVVSRRLGLRGRLIAQAENQSLGIADVRQVLLRIALIMLVCESVIMIFVSTRLWLAYDYGFGKSLWYGVFHAIQAFNNAGFALYSDSITRFVGDAWICLPLCFGVIAGSLGFPVILELLRRARRPAHWSTHTRLTVYGSAAFLLIGFLVMLAFEWSNPGTFGPLGVAQKLLAAFTQGTMPRSGGLNSVDLGAMNPETIAVTDALMFIGGGSASTAGGIKLTTFLLLAYVIWAEVNGEPDVVIGHRRMAESTQRQAMTVALLGVALVATGTLALLATTDGIPFDRALFEVISAFATVGLSTGITGDLPEPAQLVLVLLMFLGRVGTVTVASAVALNTRSRLFRYAEERPLVG